MSNILVNPDQQPSQDGFAPLPTAAELAAQQEQASQKPQAQEPKQDADDGIPDKFKGKSAAEIAQSYATLEAELGRQSQEVGTLRQLTDQLLELKRTEDLANNGGAVSDDLPEITGDDLLSDPRNTIEQVASRATRGAEERVEAIERNMALRDFESDYPTYQADMQDPEFQAYIRKSNYRSGLAQKTLQGDLDAARELWSAWDDARDSGGDDSGGTTQNANDDDAEALAQAQAIASRGGGEADVSSKPVYSRQSLMKMMVEDREAYDDPAFQAMILQAYREGRVK